MFSVVTISAMFLSSADRKVCPHSRQYFYFCSVKPATIFFSVVPVTKFALIGVDRSDVAVVVKWLCLRLSIERLDV